MVRQGRDRLAGHVEVDETFVGGRGGVSRAHLDASLDEFTFRFNRRRSRHRGKLFFRLVQQAVTLEPVRYAQLIQPRRRR